MKFGLIAFVACVSFSNLALSRTAGSSSPSNALVSAPRNNLAACAWYSYVLGNRLYTTTDQRLVGMNVQSNILRESVAGGIYTTEREFSAAGIRSRTYRLRIKFEYYQASDGIPVCSETLSVVAINR